jgi:hypothetical protein
LKVDLKSILEAGVEWYVERKREEDEGKEEVIY